MRGEEAFRATDRRGEPLFVVREVVVRFVAERAGADFAAARLTVVFPDEALFEVVFFAAVFRPDFFGLAAAFGSSFSFAGGSSGSARRATRSNSPKLTFFRFAIRARSRFCFAGSRTEI